MKRPTKYDFDKLVIKFVYIENILYTCVETKSSYPSNPANSPKMSSIKILERLQRLHSLIVQECTGSPLELSRKLHISERSVYNLLDQLKDFKAEIVYDRSRKTYYYNNDFKLQIQLSFSVISNNELTEVLAGSYLFKKKEQLPTAAN